MNRIRSHQADMEFVDIPGTSMRVSRIALGTWAIGGWMWGGSNERDAISAIHAALERGINLIDTAPVYGFGRSEEIVGKALAVGARRKRNDDPKFLSPRFEQYLAAVERLDRFALSSADFFSRNC